MTCVICIVQYGISPLPPKLKALTSLRSSWSKAGWLSFPKIHLQVMYWMSLQRWYPHVSHRFHIKHFHVARLKKKNSCKNVKVESNTVVLFFIYKFCISFFTPSATRSVSPTGTNCKASCKLCNNSLPWPSGAWPAHTAACLFHVWKSKPGLCGSDSADLVHGKNCFDVRKVVQIYSHYEAFSICGFVRLVLKHVQLQKVYWVTGFTI